MVFDSFDFLVFFGVFFTAYHLARRSLVTQNTLILVGSYIFYGWWDWRFLGLMALSTGIDYAVGIAVENTADPRRRKRLVTASVVSNLTILGVFKYFGFFTTSMAELLASLGVQADLPRLAIVLPVGISFYTFQSMAYTIDVYRGKVAAARDPLRFFAYISFFPQLVAGPIERAAHLLPQFERRRVLTPAAAQQAVWLVCWGFFLKEFVADSAAVFVTSAFHEGQTSGWSSVLGTLAFGVQIYADFNAYSLLAKGTALLLGFELMWNFERPYFSSSIQEFWRRWHISLSSWLRDYLYIPLGGNKRGPVRTYVNLMLTMLLGGLWHGAAWSFVLWGALHGGALAVHRLAAQRGLTMGGLHGRVLGWAATMVVVFVGWALFRCSSWDMVSAMFGSLGDMRWSTGHWRMAMGLAVLVAPVLLVEVFQELRRDHDVVLALPRPAFAALTGALVVFTLVMFQRFEYAFVYFQF